MKLPMQDCNNKANPPIKTEKVTWPTSDLAVDAARAVAAGRKKRAKRKPRVTEGGY